MSLRVLTAVAAAAAVIGLMSAPASAKTRAECTKEWQSQKAAMQAAHKTEKAYVAECRGASAAPTAAGSAPAKSGGSSEKSY